MTLDERIEFRIRVLQAHLRAYRKLQITGSMNTSDLQHLLDVQDALDRRIRMLVESLQEKEALESLRR